MGKQNVLRSTGNAQQPHCNVTMSGGGMWGVCY